MNSILLDKLLVEMVKLERKEPKAQQRRVKIVELELRATKDKRLKLMMQRRPVGFINAASSALLYAVRKKFGMRATHPFVK